MLDLLLGRISAPAMTRRATSLGPTSDVCTTHGDEGAEGECEGCEKSPDDDGENAPRKEDYVRSNDGERLMKPATEASSSQQTNSLLQYV